MAIKSEAVKNAVIEEDDFGHEMRVGHILTNFKYPEIRFENTYIEPPQHGGTYTDSVTGKPRQFDYRCRIARDRQYVLLALECKNLNSAAPLVVCGRQRSDDEAYHVFIASGDDKISSVRKVEGMHSVYRPGEFVGKSLLRLRAKENKLSADSNADIYDRWSQALASSVELAVDAGSYKERSSVVLPLVVVPNDSLWTVSYDDDGLVSKDPNIVDGCEFYVGRKFGIGLPFVITHIHFLTLNGLSDLLSTLVDRSGRKWKSLFSSESTVYQW